MVSYVVVLAIIVCLIAVALAESDPEAMYEKLKAKRGGKRFDPDSHRLDPELEAHFDRYHGKGSRADHDEILSRHRSRRDHMNHNTPEFHEERHRKFLDMNRRRGDRLKEQVIKASFPPEEERELLAQIEEYHDKEFEQAVHQHTNKAKLREEYGRMSKQQREVFREKEKAERFAIRDMRLSIEKRINDRNAANEL